MSEITFVQAHISHKDTIFYWLTEPHVQEFWDNSQAHKDDILNFINGRTKPSNYCNGNYVYWIAFIDSFPFSLIMTIKENPGEDREKIKNDYLSATGTTYSIDFMIGNKDHLGKGLGAKTLEAFLLFFQKNIDSNADTFFIDPDASNPRATHVYEKAGFKHIGEFIMGGTGVFRGHKSLLMIKKL